MSPPSTAAPAGAVATSVASAVTLRGARLPYGERTLWSGPGPRRRARRVPRGARAQRVGQDHADPRAAGAAAAARGRGARRRAAARAGQPGHRLRAPAEGARGGPAAARRDLVGLGLDGHRLGVGLRGRSRAPRTGRAALAVGGGAGYADAPVGRLSGGEQQRLRVAQALVGDPEVLLCDEPLLSLDLAHQHTVTELIDRRRRAADTAVLFVTHEINPILPLVDRVLYLVDGRFRIGTARRGDDLGGALDAVPHRGRRAAGARTARRGRRGRARTPTATRRRRERAPLHVRRHGELLGLPFVQTALLAAALLGLVAGVLAPLIVARGMAFAVHGTAELAFTGGAAALLARDRRAARRGGRGRRRRARVRPARAAPARARLGDRRRARVRPRPRAC